MDKVTLYNIDERLGLGEVHELCFLCKDIIASKSLENITDAKALFIKLEEHGLLENSCFLHQLLRTIRRVDLCNLLLKSDCPREETDAVPILSNFRVMLHTVYQDVTEEKLGKIKFLLSKHLGKRLSERSSTALDVFTEMEKMGILSDTNVTELYNVLFKVDSQLARTVELYIQETSQPLQNSPPINHQEQNSNPTSLPQQPFLSKSETQPSCGGESIFSDVQPDAEASSLSDETEYYTMTHVPRGRCIIFNNENFKILSTRKGTAQDEAALEGLFKQFGFHLESHKDFAAETIKQEIKRLGESDYTKEDILVICVLSHGDSGCIFGTDERPVTLQELTDPFRGGRCPTLAGKPKLFFIQACQGMKHQFGTRPSLSLPMPQPEAQFEEDAATVSCATVPYDADFLLAMATVAEHKSFRHTKSGSIFIQELCSQLRKSADSSGNDDILSVLTRVNREVGKGVYDGYKQMPEPKYTLTKKLVFKYL